MTRRVVLHKAGPGVTVQDLGWTGQMQFGLSGGGAADTLALLEGNALLGQPNEAAALEIAGFGLHLSVTAPTRIALTGADMSARIDGEPAQWNASHLMQPGQRLELGAARYGNYGYVHFGGGLATEPFLASRSTHQASGIGPKITEGTELPIGADRPDAPTNLRLPVDDRFNGGTLRLLPSVQTQMFSAETVERFQNTVFTRTPRGNRQGVELNFNGAAFAVEDQLSILSEIILPGDVQMTGEGRPFILLADCQTTGGYPRIGTIFPGDLPKAAQAAPGATATFEMITTEAAQNAHLNLQATRKKLDAALAPLVRDPHDIRNLLGYQLISGVTAGKD